MAEVTSGLRNRKFRGTIFIDWDRCKGCGYCVDFCPPKVLAFSDQYNSHGYHPPILLDEAKCTGCNLCGLYCPDFAVYGVRIPVKPNREEATAPKA